MGVSAMSWGRPALPPRPWLKSVWRDWPYDRLYARGCGRPFSRARNSFFCRRGRFIDGGPSSLLGFLGADAAFFVALLDMLGLTLLLARITRFISTGHVVLLVPLKRNHDSGALAAQREQSHHGGRNAADEHPYGFVRRRAGEKARDVRTERISGAHAENDQDDSSHKERNGDGFIHKVVFGLFSTDEL
jgi:hypothetical protein